MKKLKRLITSPASTIILFIAAAGLLLFSAIGGIRAALTYFSETYVGNAYLYNIGVSLREQCQTGDSRIVAYRDHVPNSPDEWNEVEGGMGTLLDPQYFLGDDPELIPGKAYPEELSVENTGNVDEYVRVTIYRYWLRPDGEKADSFNPDENGVTTQALSPDLIDLNLVNTDLWLKDEKASTDERMVFYYAKMLGRKVNPEQKETLEDTQKADSESVPLCDSITIDRSIADKVSQVTKENDGNHKTITTSYDYDGWQFILEADVDAVQSHNIVDAAKSAWGIDVTLNNGQIQLAN